jgi:RNA polymerase sigma-70 factor (ECF subfamily)
MPTCLLDNADAGRACGLGFLMEQARAGADDAWPQLVARVHPLLVAAAHRACGDADLAEDASQEALLVLHDALADLRFPAAAGDAPAVRWLTRTAVFCARNLCRREAAIDRRARAAAHVPAPRAAVDPLLSERLRAALARLSPDQRRLIELRFHDDLSPGDIARVLARPRGRIYVQLHRTLARLRRHLDAAAALAGGRACSAA